jgi:[glutamine synthetase] adenylyltransferase / [glutamine synthetase]-adenylyl-L-tyrosine phosphorylase
MGQLRPAIALTGAKSDRALELIPPGAMDHPLGPAIHAALTHAPYLARTARAKPYLIPQLVERGWKGLIAESLATIHGGMAIQSAGECDVPTLLRLEKAQTHFALAVADLAGEADLDQVTQALTDFADAAVGLALRDARLQALRLLTDWKDARGFTIIAMGKGGAGELNYSSDFDFTCLYHEQQLTVQAGVERKRAALAFVEHIVRTLEQRTKDGYVLRTDLRLRPDPGSTAPAVSLQMAARYYESVGQNWERAALIKARPIAGDVSAGAAFLDHLTPFIWRRHLDYAAIADITSIRRQILGAGRGRALDDPACDVKLGAGGIRDIELFVQTQQLILGGRDPSLRERRTRDALKALTKAGALAEDQRALLDDALVRLRQIEHRIQMVEDEQTHRLPADADERRGVAALCGYDDLAAFDADLAALRRSVAQSALALFGDVELLGDPAGGALVFTGVEDDPDTIDTLTAMGFREPSRVAATVRGWHHGRIRATRTERAREILTALMPRLLRALADTGEPDGAFVRFDVFFCGLSSGVQTLALLDARPELLQSLARLLAVAPRLADVLAKRPDLLDAALDPRMRQPLSDDLEDTVTAEAVERVQTSDGFEEAIDSLRRLRREEGFRIGLQVLDGDVTAAIAGRAQSRLAKACIWATALAAMREMVRVHGPAPGTWVLVALGKFGGYEMGAKSDLDIMLVYEAADGAQSDGPRPLEARDWFARFLQRLSAGLSAPTAEGILYEVDLQLRPSGKHGPVVVRVESFESYYASEAWTWELMSLTRARVVHGDSALKVRVEQAIDRALAMPREKQSLRADAADMRARLAREKPSRGDWDIKRRKGGLVDIEFAIQVSQVINAQTEGYRVMTNSGLAIERLGNFGTFGAEERKDLSAAFEMLSAARQVLDLAIDGVFEPATAPAALNALIAKAVGCDGINAATEALNAACEKAAAIVQQALATDGSIGDVSPA